MVRRYKWACLLLFISVSPFCLSPFFMTLQNSSTVQKPPVQDAPPTMSARASRFRRTHLPRCVLPTRRRPRRAPDAHLLRGDDTRSSGRALDLPL